MLSVISKSKRNNVIISTGNVLNENKKAALKSNEELIDGLKLLLEDSRSELNSIGEIHRMGDDLHEKIIENDRSNISIGAKIFLNKHSSDCIKDAMQTLVRILNVDHVDNVVLANHSSKKDPNIESNGIENLSSDFSKSTLADLKSLWSVLEEFVLSKKVCLIGIADLDTDTLVDLYSNSKVHPSIVQINLASCCVVPPPLKEFCNQHDIQLLTHSDAERLLDDESFPIPGYLCDWIVRYQVHVKCRGVLSAKGYIVGSSKQEKPLM